MTNSKDRAPKVLTAESVKKMQAELMAKREAENKKTTTEDMAADIAGEIDKMAEERLSAPIGSNKNNKATKSEMAHTVHEKAKWYRLGMEMGKPVSDDDVRHRISEFWRLCEESGEIPQKTDFYVFLNVTQQTVDRWRKADGCSRERTELIQQFDLMYNSVKDTIADKGLINTISYIWQSKQHQGYKEPKQELDISSHNPMQMFPDSKAIEAKYQDLLTGDTEVDPKYLGGVNIEAE